MVPMILDCDPGHDDAIAIIVAARHGELLGITTVAGNAPLDRTTHNALVDARAPGHRRPRPRRCRAAPAGRAATGHDGPRRERSRRCGPAHAVAAPRRTRRRRVHHRDLPPARGRVARRRRARSPTSPSRSALAPDLAGRIAGISLMGGGTFGNRSAAAEFNIWADPEAAATVFGYGGPLVMAGLDLTHQLIATAERIDGRARPSRTARRRTRRSVRVLLGHVRAPSRRHRRGRRARSVCGAGADPPRSLRPRAPPRGGRDVRRPHPRDDGDRPAHAGRAAGPELRSAHRDRRATPRSPSSSTPSPRSVAERRPGRTLGRCAPW